MMACCAWMYPFHTPLTARFKPPVDLAVAMHLAGDDELPLAADVADHDGLGTDDGRRRQTEIKVEESPLRLSHPPSFNPNSPRRLM